MNSLIGKYGQGKTVTWTLHLEGYATTPAGIDKFDDTKPCGPGAVQVMTVAECRAATGSITIETTLPIQNQYRMGTFQLGVFGGTGCGVQYFPQGCFFNVKTMTKMFTSLLSKPDCGPGGVAAPNEQNPANRLVHLPLCRAP